MSSLNEIKKKIKIVESTSKITNAMKLIATSKLKRQKTQFLNSQKFYSNIYQIFGSVVKELEPEVQFNKCEKDITIWVIFTSSMGLCGSYNMNIIKLLQQEIKPDDSIIIFGKRGDNLLKSKGINNPILMHIELNDKDLNPDVFDFFADKIIEMYFANKFKKAKIIYTKFINSLLFEPTIFDLYPFNFKDLPEIERPSNGAYFSFEPSPKKVYIKISKLFLISTLIGTISESRIAENASRRNAMEGATKNANELMNNYKLSYNRIRQSDITQEINEIVSGSKAGE